MDFLTDKDITVCQNYDCNLDNVLEQIEKYGVAVIPDVLNKTEVNNMRKGMWDTLENLTSLCESPINRYDINTWKTWFELLPTHNMLLQTYSVGHSQFIWDIRQNPKVVNVFSKIWKCQPEELITSYDAVSFHIPPEITKRGWYNFDDWFHVDASYSRKDFECVQGFVTGYDINQGDASLTFLESSNKYHSEFGKDLPYSENDWVRLSEDDLDFYYDKGCQRKNILAKEGSLILWDSRTVHCGMEPMSNRLSPNFRLVSYVCMTPRSWMSDDIIDFRKQALEKLFMTSHCPHRPRLFPKKPYYGKSPEVPDIKFPELTELGKKISGS
jgi:hypothetical protein